MSHDEKVMLLRLLDQYTTDDVLEATKRYASMNQLEQDEICGRC
jgi:hypothetical protein